VLKLRDFATSASPTNRISSDNCEFPAASLQQQAQAMRDKADARSRLINKTLASAAADLDQ